MKRLILTHFEERALLDVLERADLQGHRMTLSKLIKRIRGRQAVRARFAHLRAPEPPTCDRPPHYA